MKNHLEITVPDHNMFYSLYADGNYSWKTYDRLKKHALLYYPPEAAVFLFYTYPTYREACVIRNSQGGAGVMLPGLSKKVSVLLRARASRVDKLKRAAAWLNRHTAGACSHGDGFYARLACLIGQRGKLNYAALGMLAEGPSANSQNNLF